jgi:transcriptional regulator
MPPKREAYRDRIELLQGTLDLLILETLRWGSFHGYAIANSIRAGSGDLLDVETGSLYPALHRLEKKGWIRSEWALTENNQRAKYYTLAPAGKKQLAIQKSRWEAVSGAITTLLNRTTAEGGA